MTPIEKPDESFISDVSPFQKYEFELEMLPDSRYRTRYIDISIFSFNRYLEILNRYRGNIE
jgi:hypothetical protein